MKAVGKTQRLSTNFTLHEAIRSNTAARKGINNTPNTQQLINMSHSALGMEEIRSLLGVPCIVTSWLRVKELNRIIGSSDSSPHPKGLAVDFVPKGMTVKQAYKKIKKSHVAFKKLIYEFPESKAPWIHVEFYPFMMRGEKTFLLATKDQENKTIYSKVA